MTWSQVAIALTLIGTVLVIVGGLLTLTSVRIVT